MGSRFNRDYQVVRDIRDEFFFFFKFEHLTVSVLLTEMLTALWILEHDYKYL